MRERELQRPVFSGGQGIAGQRIEQNARRDHERHQQQRREKFGVVSSIDIALANHDRARTIQPRLKPNGDGAVNVLAQYCNALPRLAPRQLRSRPYGVTALPGPIGVAAVSANHKIAIAFGNCAAAAALGILGLLHGSSSGRGCLLNGAGVSWERLRALAGDEAETYNEASRGERRSHGLFLRGYCREQSTPTPMSLDSTIGVRNHPHELFVSGEGLKP